MLNWFIDDRGALRSGWKVFGFFLLLLALIVAATLGQRAFGRGAAGFVGAATPRWRLEPNGS